MQTKFKTAELLIEDDDLGVDIYYSERKLWLLTLLDSKDEKLERFFSNNVQVGKIELLRQHERTGRPLGVDSFI